MCERRHPYVATSIKYIQAALNSMARLSRFAPARFSTVEQPSMSWFVAYFSMANLSHLNFTVLFAFAVIPSRIWTHIASVLIATRVRRASTDFP